MITLTQSISTLLLWLIMHEAPNVREGTALYDDFHDDIEALVSVHQRVSTGLLVDDQYDVLLLSAVNYRESRMMLPAPDGDCRWGHKLDRLPSGSWPAGYKPVMGRVCNAVGPMQLNRGTATQASAIPEVLDVMTLAPKQVVDIQDTETNIRVAYAILVHWKNTCLDKDGSEAPMGVWLTAYRRGSCPTVGKSHRYYVDREAKVRCKIANDMAHDLRNSDAIDYKGAVDVPCTYADEARPRE